MIRALTIAFLFAPTLAATAWAQAYPPDGPNIPAIANSEDASGAFGQNRESPLRPTHGTKNPSGT